MSAERLVVGGARDDSFDLDQGVTGTLQWLLSIQDPSLGSHGLEVSNLDSDFLAEPRTDVVLANATLLGSDKSSGVQLREGGRLQRWNSIIAGVSNSGLDVLDVATVDEMEAGETVFRGNRIIEPGRALSALDCDGFEPAHQAPPDVGPLARPGVRVVPSMRWGVD